MFPTGTSGVSPEQKEAILAEHSSVPADMVTVGGHAAAAEAMARQTAEQVVGALSSNVAPPEMAAAVQVAPTLEAPGVPPANWPPAVQAPVDSVMAPSAPLPANLATTSLASEAAIASPAPERMSTEQLMNPTQPLVEPVKAPATMMAPTQPLPPARAEAPASPQSPETPVPSPIQQAEAAVANALRGVGVVGTPDFSQLDAATGEITAQGLRLAAALIEHATAPTTS